MCLAIRSHFFVSTKHIRSVSSLKTRVLRPRCVPHGRSCGIVWNPRNIGHNDVMDIRSNLKESITSSLKELGISVESENVSLEHPADLKNGDYSTGVALQYAKQAGIAPRVLADKIAATLGTIDGIAKIEVAGAGFINFYLTPAALAEAVETARKEDMWGSGS